jgi:hypothetical protein
MKLRLAIGAAEVEFTEAGGPYPLIVAVGSLHMTARSGDPSDTASDETPSVVVSLNNDGNIAAGIVDVPLRALGAIDNDDGSEYFSGIVSQVDFGRTVDITLEG